MVYQTQTDYDLSNYLRTYKTSLHFNRNVRPTLKCLGARSKCAKMLKRFRGGFQKRNPGHNNEKFDFIKVKNS